VSERILVLIPALNAEGSIGAVIRSATPYVAQVVVVDDGSSDRTGAVAKEAGATVLRHEVNRGKGAALKTGFQWAVDNGFDGVITLDADGQHLPSEIPRFVDCHRQTNADLIIGGRSHLFHEMLPRRRRANQFSAWTISAAAGTHVPDSQSGFRFYSLPLLRRVRLLTDGFDMESEVIVRAGRHRFKIVTIPIDLGFVDGQSTSHYKPLKDTLRIAWTVIRAAVMP
jgi:glycosyltransferase involved in cell wall biosynthesis